MKGRKILLVEDDADDKYLFSLFFAERDDILLLPAVSNGLEMVDYLMRADSEELPDLIVLDQNMPLMNGRQALQFLRSHERFAHIPAVIYSTYADSNLIMDGKKLGARMVASKPIDDEGYQKMMDDFLKVTEHQPAARQDRQ